MQDAGDEEPVEERGKRMCQLLWHHDTIEWGPTSPCASSAEGMWRGWNLGAQPARGDVVREEPWFACTPLSAVAWRLPSPNMPNGLGREQVGEVRAGAADVGPTARAACDARRRRCMADEPPRPARVRRAALPLSLARSQRHPGLAIGLCVC